MCESSHSCVALSVAAASLPAAFAPAMSEAASDAERPHASGLPGLRWTQHDTLSAQVAFA